MKSYKTKILILLLGLFLCASTLSAQVPGNCLDFDGTNDYVSCGLQNPTTFTYEAWVNPSVTNSDQAIISTLNESSGAGSELHIGASGKLYLTIRTSSSWLDCESSIVLSNSKWYHVAASYDGTTAKIYVNGTLSKSVTSTSYTAGSNTLKLGIRSVNVTCAYYKGQIGEVRVWNVARTLTQIQQNMGNPLTGSETGLLSYYQFNQQSGTTLTDTKGSYNGTLINFALNGITSNWLTAWSLPATNISNTGVTANWQSISMATKYRVDVSSDLGFNNLLVDNFDAGTATTYSFSSLTLTTGQTYYYRVRYESSYGTSSNSLPVSFSTSPGNALSFDGVDDFIAQPQIATGLSELTIETWINVPVGGQNSNGNGIYNTDSWTTGNPFIQLWANAIEFVVNGFNSSYQLNYKFIPNTWYHVAGTYNSTTKILCVYINGNLLGSYTGTASVPANLTIGRIGSYANGSPQRFFSGMMDEYRIWNHCKTQAEVQAGMFNTVVGNETYLLRAYNFDQGTAGGNNTSFTTVTDLTTNKVNGTLTSFTLNGSFSNFVISGAMAPNVFEATNVSATGFTANWNAVTSATGYRIDVSDRSDFSNLLLSNADAGAGAGTSYPVSGLSLTAGATYYYRLRSVTASGISPNSVSKTVMLYGGNALATDGSDDYVITSAINPSTFTMEAWVNPSTSSKDQAIVSTLSTAGAELHISVANYPCLTLYTGSGWKDILSTATISTGKWVHITGTYDGTTAKLYVNGTLVNSATCTYSAGTAALNIGRRAETSLPFRGIIDNVAVWNRALADSEVQSSMYSSLAGNESGLKAFFNFDQGVGNGTNTGLTSIPDLSQNGNTATLNNSVLTGTTYTTSSNYVPSSALSYILDATNATTTGFTANWNPVPAATGFLIDVSNKPDFSNILKAVTGISSGSTTNTVTGLTLTAGASYYYRMRYTTSSGTSGYSDVKTFVASPGNALIFDGTDDYVDLKTVSPSGNFSTGFTYMGWVKWDAFQKWSRLFDFNKATADATDLLFLGNNDIYNKLRFSSRDGANEGFIETGNIIPTGQWVHVAATINAAGWGIIYINGQNIVSGTVKVPNSAASRTSFCLGKSYNTPTDSYFKGSMDEVSFWTRALTQEEINAYMNNSLSGSENGLYIYYKFDQGTSSTTVTDAMGHNNGDLKYCTGTNFVTGSVNIATNPVPVIYNPSNIIGTGFTANWKAISGASFFIDVSDMSDFSHLLVSNVVAGSGTSFDLKGLNLKAGANYYYRMRYVSATVTSGNSVIKPFMISTGNAIYMNGADDEVAIPQLASGLDEVTFETWLNCDAINGYAHGIYNTIEWATGNPHLQFNTSNQILFSVYGNSPVDLPFKKYLTSGQWYHVAVTYKASSKTVTMYLNGVKDTSYTYSTANAVNLTRALMGSYASSRYFNGKFDNYRIWSKVRTQAEIQSTMNADVIGNESNLLLSYNFNHGQPNKENTAFRTMSDATSNNPGYSSTISFTSTISNYVINNTSNNVFYVNASASAGGTGLSPTSAFNNLSDAFAAATGNDTIKIATGTYYQPAYNVSLANKGYSLTLLGGYNSSFTTCDPTNNVTVISGASGATNSILNIYNCNLTLNGFTLQNGLSTVSSSYGGALRFYAGSAVFNLKVNNCIFQNNKNTSNQGGAVYIHSNYLASVASFTNCKFYNNTAAVSNGGAIWNNVMCMTLTNCLFDNNYSAGNGGAIYITGGAKDSIFSSTFIRNRVGGNASAIDIQGSTLYMVNSTVYNNTTAGTGAIHPDNGSTAYLYHNTIVGNTGSTAYCGGVSQYNSTTYLFGNIIVGNVGYNGASDVWNQTSTLNDLGYNLYGATDANQANFTINSTLYSQWIKTADLYEILESANQSNKAARLFPALVTNNGGTIPTIKVIGRAYKNSTGVTLGVRTVPRSTYNVTTDQRGNGRLFKAATIGAYEMDLDTTKKVIYVNGNLAATGDGSLANPYNNLQIAIAASANDTIKIVGATYYMPGTGLAFGTNCSNGLRDVILLGAYDKDFKTRDTVTNRTILQNLNSTVPIIWHINSNLTVENITFKNGLATSSTYEGAAIHFYAAAGTYNCNLRNCIFTGNTLSSGNGGALYINAASAASVANITNCIFNRNIASSGKGGAIATAIATVNISNSTFLNNKSTAGDGGAVQIVSGTYTIKNCTFFNNTAQYQGGAIANGGNLTLINNTITGNTSINTSPVYSAGLGCYNPSTTIIQGNIIAGNKSGGYPADIQLMTGTGFTDNGYNILGNGGCTIYNVGGVLGINSNSNYVAVNQLYNILESTDQSNTSALLFPAKVANNGGATPTIKLIGKYFNSTTVTNLNIRQVPANLSLTTDQRGVARTVGAACIGAYEMNAADKYIYVNISAAAGGDGSFAKPFRDIPSAIDAASLTDTIKVVAGVYTTPNSGAAIVVNKNVNIIGGYNNIFSEYDPRKNATIIDIYGSGTNPIFSITNTSAEINGFTLRQANSNGQGGGVNVDITSNTAYNIKIKNNIFLKNKAGNGAGVCLNSTATSEFTPVSITACTFNGNTATTKGGAIFSTGKIDARIFNNTFFGNTAANNGGAIWQGIDGKMSLYQNTIVGNKCTTTTAGGGVACTNGQIDFWANIIAKNTSGANYHNVYKESGTITDRGYNLIGSAGSTGYTKAATTDSITVTELAFLLSADTVLNYGGATPTMKLKKKTFNNAAAPSVSKTINIVPAEINSINLEPIDQRGVNRLLPSCIGSFEYRDTIQTKNITVTSTANTASIHFTPGSFSKRVVFMKNGTATTELPSINTTYLANNAFGSGTQIGISGWYCVYNGSDTMFTVTGLNPVDTFAVKAFEYNDVTYYYTVLPVSSNNPVSIITPKKTQSINFSLAAKYWGDADFTLTDSTSLGLKPVVYTSSNTAVATVVGNLVHITGVGTTIITANQVGNAIIAAAPTVNRSLIVKADSLYITAANTSGKYGEVPVFNFSSTGLKNNDSIIAHVGVTYTSIASDSSNVGTYDVTPSAAIFGRGVSSNYILIYNKGIHTISPATLTVKADDKTKVFGTVNPAFSQTPAGLKNGNTIEVSTYFTGASDLSSVGTYDIMPSNASFTKGSASNYTVVYTKGTLTVTPALVTVKTADTSKVYGTANPAFRVVASGLKSTDAIANASFTTSANDSSVVGTYSVTLSGAAFSSGNASNYTLSYSAGNLSVTKAQLTVTAKDTVKVYGDVNPTAFAYKVTGLKYSDKMGTVTYTTTATQSSKTGTYEVVPSGATLSVGADNYSLNYVKGNITVTKAPLTITANNLSKVYGSKNPTFTIAATGLKLTDSIASVNYTSNADSASKVGTYNIVPSNAAFKTAVADNYAVTYVNGNLSVSQAQLTIKADDKTKAYFSAVNPSFTASYIGFVNGETASILSTQPVASCTAVKTSKAGTYPISFSGAKADNYAISYLSGNLTITESPVQICLVTVDSETGKNLVIWQRNKGLGIASYKVYRETSTADVYEVLSTIPFAKVGEYIDLTSKPKNQQHRYKISAVDSLGNESVLSHYHQNVFLQYNSAVNGINLSWKPYEIEGGTMEFKSYVLYRGADSTKLDSFQTLSANATVYIDTDPIASTKLMFYRIGGVLKSACNTNSLLKAGGGVYVQAISNMEDNRLRSTSIVGLANQMSLAIYPQPASDFINVSYALEKPAQVTFEILNIMGESIATVEAGQAGTELTNNRLDINQFNLQNGIYYLKLNTKYQTGIKKFIVTK